MNVALFGGTGFVGTYLIEELLNNNHTPVLLVREGSENKVTRAKDCIINIGDVSDKKTIEDTIRDVDAVIYNIGLIRQFPRKGITFENIHFKGAKTRSSRPSDEEKKKRKGGSTTRHFAKGFPQRAKDTKGRRGKRLRPMAQRPRLKPKVLEIHLSSIH